MNRVFMILSVAGIIFFSNAGYSHSFNQRASIFSDSNGVKQERLDFSVGADFKHASSSLTDTNYNLSLSKDQFFQADISDNEYAKQIQKTNGYEALNASVLASQTWQKLTDTRIIASYGGDAQVTAQTLGVGVSHWFWHESLQISADLSRTDVERPLFEVLDVDVDIISPPTHMTSVGLTIGLKHLATPTTVTNYTVGAIQSNDRPLLKVYGASIKQYLPRTSSAIHANLARAVNTGTVTTKSNYGEVVGNLAELSWLQETWKGARTKLGYRYYKEDEITRALGDELTLGSDAVTLGLVQEIPDSAIDALSGPVTMDLSATKYITNTNIAANIYELGFKAKF